VTLRLTKRVAAFAEPLDPLGDALRTAVGAVPRPIRDVVDGVWLGNPLHPALTDVPLGAWSAAAALDLLGSEEAADAALAIGVVGAVPAAIAGINDASYLRGETQRIALVHGLLNTVGLALNVGSLLLRRRGDRTLARALSGTAFVGSLVSAHLGGELSFGLGTRVNRTAFERPRDRYAAVLDESELEGGKLCKADLEGVDVLVARSEATGQVCAIAHTCTHLGGPLSEGTREDDTVICPWHGSRFDLCTGDVLDGPAVYPEPRFEARVRAGKVEVRAARDE
jgi:nitrite reductase/ring-hydroxylating ferredoxin subunit